MTYVCKLSTQTDLVRDMKKFTAKNDKEVKFISKSGQDQYIPKYRPLALSLPAGKDFDIIASAIN
jgi:hypothetical protein